ncbi:hypothetical protein C2S51_021049 [Perilla frutescens var. frutescens]|nr:hypothetical protein C2S51_021049 [Perilla frutescens var. frutescens]
MEVLKKEARSMLMDATSIKLMILIDKLERLGLAYHFETEIEAKLKQVYDSAEEEQDYDLFATALRFRLLRQHQYHVSSNAFEKFVDKDNKLKESFYSDIAGLLSLYEAAHVRIHDENILDEAVAFTTHHLSNMLPELESPIKEKVQQALDYSLHKSLTIFNLRFYISIYEQDDSRDELLLRLAKLNFNFLQNIYRNEIFELTTWNMDAIDVLPDYLQTVYNFFMSEYEDFESEAKKQGKSFATPYYIEAMKQLGRAFGKEQKWIMEREMPIFEEYMANSQITALIYITFTAVVPGLKSTNKETLDWLLSAPQIFLSTAKSGRLLDDLASHQRESKEGKMLTIVDCYMKDKGVSREETLCAFAEIIEDGWKHVNAEWVNSRNTVPKEMIEQFLNILRMAEITYNNSEDGISSPENNLTPLILALLVDPLLI